MVKKETATQDLSNRKTDLDDCMKAIGEAMEAMGSAKAMLADDEQYMKDLTAKCELKAKEWELRLFVPVPTRVLYVNIS